MQSTTTKIEMNHTTIAEVATLANKMPIEAISGVLTKVWDYKEGSGQYGPYSFQNGELKDSTGVIRVTFSNHPDMKRFVNQLIILSSYAGDRGLSGVMADDNTYENKTTRQIKVTKTANIEVANGQNNAPAAPPASPNAPAGSGQPTRPAGNAELDLRMALIPALNAMHIIEQVATAQSDASDADFDPVNFGGKCAQLFKRMDAQGLVDRQSNVPLWAAVPDKPTNARGVDPDDDEIPF